MITDNATSYSEFTCHQRCPMKYKYNYIWRIQRKIKNIDLHRGILAHSYLEAGFLAIQNGDIIQDALDGMTQAFLSPEYTQNLILDDEFIEHEDMVREAEAIINNYFMQDHWREWEVLHVEETFYIEVEGEIISFTPDLVVRRLWDNSVWVVDHKTTTSKLDNSTPHGDLQAGIYVTGVKALYPECQGFIWDRIRWKLPSEPRLAKTGNKRVAYLNTIDTTFEVLRDFMVENDLMNDNDHRARLAQLRQVNTFFQTTEYEVTPEFEENFWGDLLAQKVTLDAQRDTGRFYRVFSESHYDGCDRCSYQVVCKAELEGGVTEQLLAEFYEPLDMSHRQYEEA